jgi:hypothetical protein
MPPFFPFIKPEHSMEAVVFRGEGESRLKGAAESRIKQPTDAVALFDRRHPGWVQGPARAE